MFLTALAALTIENAPDPGTLQRITHNGEVFLVVTVNDTTVLKKEVSRRRGRNGIRYEDIVCPGGTTAERELCAKVGK